MIINASTRASNSEAVGRDLQFDRRYALVALHAARHLTCPAYGPLQNVLICLLLQDGYSFWDTSRHTNDLIEIASGVITSIDAGEPRKTPWPGGKHAAEYAQAMYEMEGCK